MSGPLDKLHDFYQPLPPAWTPQTIGWYVLFAVAGLVVLWLVVHTVRRWFRNRYRREALHELALLPAEQFSTLLKTDGTYGVATREGCVTERGCVAGISKQHCEERWL